MIVLKRLAFHPLARVILFGILVLTPAFFLMTLPLNPIIKKVILSFVILAMTAFFLKIENRSFQAIGISLKAISFKYLAVGILFGVGMLIVTALLTKGMVGFHWRLNSTANFTDIFILLNFYFWSVLVEELMFRGYGFQRLAQYKGKWVALIFVGLFFGLFHIHDRMSMPEILGTMLTTGVGHIFFGLAVLKMKNLVLPLGLHMGWNLAQELMPRHPSLNTESSIFHVVPSDGLEYSTAFLLIPYLAVIILGCLVFLFYKDKSLNELDASKV